MKTSLILVSLAALVAMAGCRKNDAPTHQHATHDSGGHAHTAPHGGVLVELGDHAYNLEFVVLPETGRLLVYLLNGHADEFVRTSMSSIELTIMDGDEKRTLVLQPMENVITGETVGNTSLYAGEAEWLKRGAPFTGLVHSVSVGGARFVSTPFAVPATVR